MNLTISGHHVDVTPAIRSHVENKLNRLKRNLEGVIDIKVVLTVENVSKKDVSQRAEITVNMPGKALHVTSSASDLYAAIDLLMDKVERQVVKTKEKTRSHSRDAIKNLSEDEK